MQVFSKRQIYDYITGFNERDNLHTVEITISKVRKKLEQYTGRGNFIITIRGRGYKFKK
ncbi:MAG: helix-turn-helix domain-containing protein [Clostridium sp.]|nr:helix-turn-helix domain-containing protein [Clostridium sp.]